MAQGFVVSILVCLGLPWLAGNSLGDWGSPVQIRPLRPIKSSTSEFLCKSAKSPGTARGQDFRWCLLIRLISAPGEQLLPSVRQELELARHHGHERVDRRRRPIGQVRPVIPVVVPNYDPADT